MFRTLARFLAGCLLLTACATPGGLRHTEVPGLNGATALFDQAIVDQSTHRLYLADATLTSVDVFDVTGGSPRFLSSVRLGKAPHGLAIADDLHKVFVGIDGGVVAVIEGDPAAKDVNTVIARIQTSAVKNVDLVDYDPIGHILWAASGDDALLTKIDAIRNLPIGQANLSKGLEQPRYNYGDHFLYLLNSSKNVLDQIDPDQLTIVNQWPLGVPCGPTGMGLDPKRNIALIGCGDPTVFYALEWDLSAGRRVQSFNQVGPADQVVYDAANDIYLVAGASSGVTAVGFFGGAPLAYLTLKLTHADSRAAALDDASLVVFTPDSHTGEHGLLSFALPAKETQAPPFVAPLLYLLPLLLVGLAVWYYGSRRARARRTAGRPLYS